MATGVSQETLNQLSQLFTDTLNPAAQKQAEQNLTSLERQPEQHFPVLLLALISSPNQPIPVRLAASIKLKNICRRAWSDEDSLEIEDDQHLSIFQLVPEPDRIHLKAALLPLLIQLSQPSVLSSNPIGLRLQLSESIALIANKDFPDSWPNLIDEMVVGVQTSSPDSVALQAVLQTAHSIFRKWRAAFRSDLLYTEINYVLAKFAQPFLELLNVSQCEAEPVGVSIDSFLHPLMQRTDEMLSQPSPPAATTTTLLLLTQLFHDLSAQDLPPLFEDNLQSIFALLLKYLNPRASPDGIFIKSPALALLMDGPDDETTPQDGQKIRAEICSIGELYAQRYLDAAESIVPGFVKNVWEMLGGCGKEEKEDIVSEASIKRILMKRLTTDLFSWYRKQSRFSQLWSRCPRREATSPVTRL
jgi:exportin-2 (importin alpha re-exporter)